MACKMVSANPEEDDLEGLRHLTFQETKGEMDLQEGSVRYATHLLPVKLQNKNIEMEGNVLY